MEVILTHENTDFDALASLLAASKLNPEAIAVLPHSLNRNLRDFLTLYRSSLPFRRADELPRRPIEQAILVDTQQVQAVRGMTHDTPIRVIDHHPREHELSPTFYYWGEEVGATTTLLVEQIIGRGISLSPIEATLLFLGIYEDTGSLSYISTTARDMRCAAWLLEHGANLEVVNTFLHHPLTAAQQRLLKQLQASAQTLDIGGHTIVIAAAEAGEQVEEISTLAHKLRDIFDPDGLFLIVDLHDRIQLIARSTTTFIDVSDIAGAFGGGGHARAAAALIRHQSLADVQARLLEVLKAHVRPPMTVRQIMSWGVSTLSPDITVAEADERMKRLGHEGFPVVEDGKLLGLMTRRELDRALHHHLYKVPVNFRMRPGSFTISIDDSVQTLQKRMMESGWGQMPVLDEGGQMVGIVTRTDLLKLWTEREPALTAPSAALRMQESLPSGLLDLLRQVGEAAAELGYPLYAVGGFVRDLLLHRPNLDLDLVVEGEAAHLARKLAQSFGGRVKGHKRFGTAKWIRDDAAFAAGSLLPDGTPASLDFAAARTEFYQEATALPIVESSNIKLDLHRRDFTINTLAVRLDGPHWGEMLDFYHGQKDLENGVIRVLHSLSFIEDPTRILRAARFEQRFGFHIDHRTEQLIAEAVDLLARVSGSRLRHEFELIFQEKQPERALRRLDQLGVLVNLHPQLAWPHTLDAQFQALRQTESGLADLPADVDQLYFGLWMRHCGVEVQRFLLDRLRVNARTRSLVEEGIRFAALEPDLAAPVLAPSQIDRLLSPFSDAALLIAHHFSADRVLRQRLDDYTGWIRPVTIHLSGDRLKALGVRPGPIYRRILQTVRAARLDGRCATPEDEEALALALIAEQKEDSDH